MKKDIKCVLNKFLISLPAILAVVLSVCLGVFAACDLINLPLAVSVIFAIIIAVFAFYHIIVFKKREKNLKRELETLKNETNFIKEYYSYIDSKIDEVDKLRHEFRNYLTIADSPSLEKEDIAGITQSLEEKATLFFEKKYCDNRLVNIIINKKEEEARKNNISFSCSVYIPKDISIDEYDLCSCVFNLLDNALYANLKAGEEENKYIEFKASIISGYLMMKMKNTSFEKPSYDSEGNIVTSKETEGHGYGLKIINDICIKYNGYSEFEQKDGVFYSTLGLLIQ